MKITHHFRRIDRGSILPSTQAACQGAKPTLDQNQLFALLPILLLGPGLNSDPDELLIVQLVDLLQC